MPSVSSSAAAAVRETTASTRLVLANPNLRRVNLALVGSMIGDWAYATAVTVYAYSWGGAAAVGTYVALRMALVAVALPVLTAVADRLPRKPFLVAVDLLRVVIIGVAAVIIVLDGPALVVLTLGVVVSLIGSPFRPVQSALLPDLATTPHELTAANAVSSTVESVAFFVGPAIAGLLLIAVDVPVIYLINAATFAWSALMIGGLRLPAGEPAGEPSAEQGTAPASDDKEPGCRAEAAAGFRFIWSDRRLRQVLALCGAQTLVCGASLVFTVVLAVDLLRVGPKGVGYLDALLGVGAIVGGVVAIARSRRARTASDFGVGVAGWALPLLLVAAWPHPVTVVVASLLIGLANPLVDVNVVTLLQRMVPGPLMARVFGALETVVIGGVALGAFVMPGLIALVGLRWALVIIAVPVAVAVVLSAPLFGRLDRELAPPPHLDLVAALPLFQPLPPAAQEQLARQLTEVRVTAGDQVITAGETGDRFYLIENGRFEAVRGADHLRDLGPGDCFGEIALLRDVPRTASVVATTGAVLQALERDDFLAAVSTDPEAAGRAELLVSARIVR